MTKNRLLAIFNKLAVKFKSINDSDDNLFISFAISTSLHLLLIYFFLFGLPSFSNKFLDNQEEVISFEMLQVSTVSNVENKQKQNEKAVQNEEAKKVEKTKSDQQIKEEPKEEVKPIIEEEPKEEVKPIIEEAPKEEVEPIIKEEPKEEVKPIIEEAPKEEVKPIIKEEPKEEVKPAHKEAIDIKGAQKPEPKKEDKKKEKQEPPKSPIKNEKIKKDKKKKVPNDSDLESLLKNLEQSSKGNNAKSAKYSRDAENKAQSESIGPHNVLLLLSISEQNLIKQQIQKNWNIPMGLQNVEKTGVILDIVLAEDGSVIKVSIVEKVCNNISDSLCQALVESAQRAVWQANPIQNLIPEHYKFWKEFHLGFYPHEAP